MIAARSSKCPGCGEPISEGDRIELVDDEWVCAGCAEADEIESLMEDDGVVYEDDYELD
jgi:hypothetical protein